MHTQLLIEAVVRQTTVLIAQLATAGGLRAPLAHVAGQVFLDLARELEAQGVSRKVSADMFGIALRTYQRKTQRLRESATDRGRSLWEAVLSFLESEGVVTRGRVLARFRNDDQVLVRGVLRDLTDSGLVFASGSGDGTAYRAARAEELAKLRDQDEAAALDALVWGVIYREGPLHRDRLASASGVPAEALGPVLQRLLDAGRVALRDEDGEQRYASRELFIPLEASAGSRSCSASAASRARCAPRSTPTTRCTGFRRATSGWSATRASTRSNSMRKRSRRMSELRLWSLVAVVACAAACTRF